MKAFFSVFPELTDFAIIGAITYLENQKFQKLTKLTKLNKGHTQVLANLAVVMD